MYNLQVNREGLRVTTHVCIYTQGYIYRKIEMDKKRDLGTLRIFEHEIEMEMKLKLKFKCKMTLKFTRNDVEMRVKC